MVRQLVLTRNRLSEAVVRHHALTLAAITYQLHAVPTSYTVTQGPYQLHGVRTSNVGPY